MLHLALQNQLFDCAGHVLDGHVRINAMLVKQVNRLDFEPFERSLDHSFDAFRLAGHTTLLAAVAIESELRGNDYLLTERSECFADEFLVGERAIDFGGVEESDALFHG